MELYRKYVDDEQLRVLAGQTPSWGVDILTIGHNLHQPRKAISRTRITQTNTTSTGSKGRILDEFQLVYIANGQGRFRVRNNIPHARAGRHGVSAASRCPGIASSPMADT